MLPREEGTGMVDGHQEHDEAAKRVHRFLSLAGLFHYHSNRIVTCIWRGRKPLPPYEVASVAMPSAAGFTCP